MKFLLMLLLVACGTTKPNAPQMERKIKVWNGAPDAPNEPGICRLSSAKLGQEYGAAPEHTKYIKRYHQGFLGEMCLPASADEFKLYACMTFADLGVVYGLIETMYSRCEKWKAP